VVTGQWAVEDLKRQSGGTIEAEKTRLRKATKEFESFFLYQMLKVMRETVPDNPLTKNTPLSGGLGKETFTQIFDMEVARKTSIGGPNSIADLLYASMEKLIDARFNAPQGQATVEPLDPPRRPIELTAPSAVPLEPADAPLPLESRERMLQLEGVRRGLSPGRTDATTRSTPDAEAPAAVTAEPDRVTAPAGDPIVTKFGKYIDEAALESGLDSTVIASVIRAESSGNPRAVSPAGAKGLMQLVDSTAADMEVDNVFDPQENIRGGSRYLRRMIDRFGSLELGLAAYNAGPGNVEKYGGMPPFTETRQYVKRVMELVTDQAPAGAAPGVTTTPSAGRMSLSDEKIAQDSPKAGNPNSRHM
jgi:soluble lytic murein transglycosylase-like protein